jgi:hypothetical protein
MRSSRALFKIGLWSLILVAVLMPISECFDTWDKAGIDDNQLTVFAIVVLLCLLLALFKILTGRAYQQDIEVLPAYFAERPPDPPLLERISALPVALTPSPPLRI